MRILLASIYPYVFLLLFATIPFDDYVRALPNILLAILAILFPFVVQKDHFRKIKKVPAFLLCMFFLYLLANAFLNQRLENDWGVIQKVGLAIGLALLYIPIDRFSKMSKAIIFSSVAAILYSVGKLILVINNSENFNIVDSAMIIEAVLIDRIYLGLLCILSILVSYRSMKDTYHPDNKYYVINIVLNILFVLLITSRISIIVLILIFLMSLLFKKKRLPQLFFVTGGFLLIVAFAFILNNDLRKKVFYTGNIKNQGLVENTLASEPRTVIWDCAYQIANKQGTTFQGQGFVKTNTLLLDCYDTTITDASKKRWFLFHKYNTHNQFIDFYLATGTFGFLLFSISLIIIFLRHRKYFFPSAVLVSLICFALVENVFHRQIGAYYVGFIFIVLLISNRRQQKQSLNE